MTGAYGHQSRAFCWVRIARCLGRSALVCYARATMANYLLVLAIGLAAGILGGFFGVGGGVLIVPALVLLLGVEQHMAVGTSLGALLPPVGILGAYEYYKHGQLNITFGLLLGAGLLVGGYFGAKIAVTLPALALRRAFAIFLLIVSVRMLMR
jgi:uncharacterized protein